MPVEFKSNIKNVNDKIGGHKCDQNRIDMIGTRSNFFRQIEHEEFPYQPGDSDQEMFKKINSMIQSHSDQTGLTTEAFEKLADDVMRKSKLTLPIERSGRLVAENYQVARCYENNSDQILNCAGLVAKFHQTVSEVSMDMLKTYQV